MHNLGVRRVGDDDLHLPWLVAQDANGLSEHGVIIGRL